MPPRWLPRLIPNAKEPSVVSDPIHQFLDPMPHYRRVSLASPQEPAQPPKMGFLDKCLASVGIKKKDKVIYAMPILGQSQVAVSGPYASGALPAPQVVYDPGSQEVYSALPLSKRQKKQRKRKVRPFFLLSSSLKIPCRSGIIEGTIITAHSLAYASVVLFAGEECTGRPEELIMSSSSMKVYS
jgi:hypothetical protein